MAPQNHRDGVEEVNQRENGFKGEKHFLANPPPGEEVCITGIAGIFPESNNITELKDNLFNKVNLINDATTRWDHTFTEIPKYAGKVPRIEKYDAGFFGIGQREANYMDPGMRMVNEQLIQAMMDAGLNPYDFQNERCGIFFASHVSETLVLYQMNDFPKNANVYKGAGKPLAANSLNYILKTDGPSTSLDTACSSSAMALADAYRSIRLGKCDCAIVAGVQLCMSRYSTLQFYRLGVLNTDGKCRTFDEDATGYSRSETIGVVVLQKAKDAKRVYCKVIHGNVNCDGFKEQGITFPNREAQRDLMQEILDESGIHPDDISYMEAHGTGTKVGDPEEAAAIDEVFGKKRKEPLLIGSVKSNLGHSEIGSGLCSLAKVIIAAETGIIAPNIHLKKPRKEITGINEGRLIPVVEKTPLVKNDAIMGVNNFGFGGLNVHMLLQRNQKVKTNGGQPKDNLPRLVCISGRVEETITNIMGVIKQKYLDSEYVALLHNIYRKAIPGNHYRGYCITSKSAEIERLISNTKDVKKQLYICFGSLDKSWKILGRHLLLLPVFAGSLYNIHNVLSAKNVNITDILTNNIGDNGVNYDILGNIAIQIGIVDIMKALGVKPDGIFGDTIGELVCEYFEGNLTLEETLFIAYELAKLLKDTSATIHAAEMNGGKSFTNGTAKPNKNDKRSLIHAASEVVNQVKLLQQIRKHEKELLEKVKKIIKEPRQKLRGWLSGEKLEAATLLGALKTPLNYEQIYSQMSSDCVMLEIGSGQINNHFTGKCKKIETLQFDHEAVINGGLEKLLSVLGRLYIAGNELDLAKLYPAVDFPVSRATPFISPLVKWRHDVDWYVNLERNMKKAKRYSISRAKISLFYDEQRYISGHVIDELNLFPAIGYLFLVLETLVQAHQIPIENAKIVFENCKFHRATTMPKDTRVVFDIAVLTGSGAFEVTDDDTVVVSGRISIAQECNFVKLPEPVGVPPDKAPLLTTKDIYKELKIRGYKYRDQFRAIVKADISGATGHILWNDNLVTFMDNMLQMQILHMDSRCLFVPTFIQKLTLDNGYHRDIAKKSKDSTLPVYLYPEINLVRSGGIEVIGLQASSIARRKPLGEPVLEKYIFVPNETNLELKQSVRVIVQMVLENDIQFKFSVAEVIDEETNPDSETISPLIEEACGDLPLVAATVTVVQNGKIDTDADNLIIVGSKLLSTSQALNNVFKSLKKNGYVLSREPLSFDQAKITQGNVTIMTVHETKSEKLVLFREKSPEISNPFIICVNDDKFQWLHNLQEAVKQEKPVIVYSQSEPLNGIVGLVNCIRKEPGGSGVRCFLIRDTSAPRFDINDKFYKEQLGKNFAINIFENNTWGTYKHLLLEEIEEVVCENRYIDTLVKGDLSSFRWIQGPLSAEDNNNGENPIVRICYSSLNFKDVMTASGRLITDDRTLGRTHSTGQLGIEYSGLTLDGKKVMGMCVSGSIANLATVDKSMMIDVPDKWSLEEAATVPCVYGTVLYAIFKVADMKPGQSILIHAGTGGIGMAAINIALYYGCEVFTTVGTPEKRQFIRDTYPQIPESHIGNSRDTSFEEMIMVETKGRGVDFVLNSLVEEKLIASVRCLTRGGKFLEIGKYDLQDNKQLSVLLFEREASYHGVMVDRIMEGSDAQKAELMSLIVSEIKKGSVKPLKRHIFHEDQIEEAFRFMASAKHMGKVIIKIADEKECKKAKMEVKRALPRYYCDPNKSYIVCGGLGGFGLELADWLIVRGARKLVLTSRSGVKTGYQAMRIRRWKSYGTILHISTSDITTHTGCQKLIEEANNLGPVEAIFNLAVVLSDAILENQSVESFKTSFAPKAYATQYLDELSRDMCPELRDFVIFSSVSCGRGNPGQTNYGMANSVMERICEKRKQEGYPALAIEWGVVGDVGLVADMQEEDRELEIAGTLQQSITNCLEVIDMFLKQNNPVVSSMVVAEKKVGAAASNCIEAVANILGIKQVKAISYQVTLAELGMDSMRAVEVKQTLERDFGIILSAKEIRNLTFSRLKDFDDEMGQEVDETAKAREEGSQYIYSFLGEDIKEKTVSLQLATNIAKKTPAPTVICIPGIEGVAYIIKPLAKCLDCHAYALQHAYQTENSLAETAKKLSEHVEKIISRSEPFRIIGHSVGGLISLELAAVLESRGYIGKVIVVDSYVTIFKTFMKDLRDDIDIDTEIILRVVTTTFSEKLAKECASKILEQKTVEDKVRAAVDFIIPASTGNETTRNNLEHVFISMHKNLKTGISYQPGYAKIKSKVTLFKPTDLIMTQLPHDYNLSSICGQTVDVHTLEGNHSTILLNPELAKMINEWIKS